MKDEKKAYIKYLSEKKGAKIYNEFKRILYGKPDSLVLKMFSLLFPYVKSKKKLRILDIGGGDGKRLMLIMDLLGNKGIEASAVLVEPSKAFTDECRKAIKSSNYNIKIARSLFEDFESKEKFDLILMIHSYFSLRDFPIFEKFNSLLANNGYILIAGNDQNSFLAKLKKITARRRKGNRKEIDFIFSELERNKLKYKIKKARTIFDNCIKNNRLTADGKLIASWIALAAYPKIQGNIKKEMLEVFKIGSKNSKISEKEVFIVAWE